MQWGESRREVSRKVSLPIGVISESNGKLRYIIVTVSLNIGNVRVIADVDVPRQPRLPPYPISVRWEERGDTWEGM